MNKEIILLMITIILVILGFYCLYKYKKETLWVIACYVVTRAEEEFISGEGKSLKKGFPHICLGLYQKNLLFI